MDTKRKLKECKANAHNLFSWFVFSLVYLLALFCLFLAQDIFEAIVSTRDVHTSEANASTEYTSPFEQPTSQHTRRQRVPPSRVSCAPRLLPASFAQKTRKNNACSAGYCHLEFALVLSRSVRVKSKHKHKGTFTLQKVEVCDLRVCEMNRATRVKRKISNKKINKQENVLSWMLDISLCLNVPMLASPLNEILAYKMKLLFLLASKCASH